MCVGGGGGGGVRVWMWVCELRKLLVCLVTFVFSITVLQVLNYAINMLLCTVMWLMFSQPRFNFSDEIIILDLEAT